MTSTTIFNGTSRYSSDFQAVIDRSVAIASLPLTQLNTVKTQLTGQSTALSGLDSKFSALQTAITSLETGLGLNSYTTSVSNAAIAKATPGTGAIAGSYTLEVTNFGAYAHNMTKSGLTQVTDPATEIMASGTLNLTIDGGTAHSFAETNLNDLAAAINAQSDLGVQAAVVNVGPPGSADYRLSLQNTELGAHTFSLTDLGPTELLQAAPLSAGVSAAYKVNGIDVTGNSRTITLAPGLTVEMLKENGTDPAVTITVTRNTQAVSSALTSFTNAYNAALDELDKHRGGAKGALAGQSIVSMATQGLRQIAGYNAGSGTLASLEALGLTFDDKGKISFDSAAFSTATANSFTALSTFLGSSSGSGFLKAATDVLNGLEDSTGGTIKTSIAGLQDEITAQDKSISNQQARVDLLRKNLQARIAAADALIASLEQKVTYFTGMFDAMRTYSRSL